MNAALLALLVTGTVLCGSVALYFGMAAIDEMVRLWRRR